MLRESVKPLPRSVLLLRASAHERLKQNRIKRLGMRQYQRALQAQVRIHDAMQLAAQTPNPESLPWQQKLEAIAPVLVEIAESSPGSQVLLSIPDQHLGLQLPAQFLPDLSTALMLSTQRRNKAQ